LMHAHLGGLLRDPSAVRPDLPKAVSSVIRKAMARRAEHRYDGVGAFLEALRDAVPERRVAKEPEAPRAGRAGRTGRTGHDARRGDGDARSSQAPRDGGVGTPSERRRRGGLWRWFRRED